MKLGNAARFWESCGLHTLPWSVHLKELILVTVSFRWRGKSILSLCCWT